MKFITRFTRRFPYRITEFEKISALLFVLLVASDRHSPTHMVACFVLLSMWFWAVYKKRI